MKQNRIDDKQKYRGEKGFELYYGELFNDRWENLKKSLLLETKHASLTFPDCQTYFMDPASICAALCLPVSQAEKVLDLCAAPGGKTLVVASNLSENAFMTSNERSPERKNRLAKVVEQSLPENLRSRINVTCSDGATLCKKDELSFQSILLDAPCSSERHVLKDQKYLSQWSPSRLKTMAMEQWALASSAWRMLEENGFLLYATCALSTKENDEIIERLLKKFPDAKLQTPETVKTVFNSNLGELKKRNIKIEILKDSDEEPDCSIEKIFSSAHQTKYGMHILPDSSSGYGPLFFALIQKESPA